MGIFDKIKGMVGSDDLDYNDYDGDLFGDDASQDNGNGNANNNGEHGQQNQQNAQNQQSSTQNSQPQQSQPADGPALELKVVKPDRYENVYQIADHLLNRRTVVLNLEGTNKETAKRLIDFLGGVVYSINGQLKRVANNTFVITPNNVDVSGDQMKSAEPKPEPEPAPASSNIYAEL